MTQPQTFLGFDVLLTDHAVRVSFEVHPWPIKKRRRGYKVVRKVTPCVMMMGRRAFVHPAIYARYKMENIVATQARGIVNMLLKP